jgi:NADH-quinone oxidoreductase subunit D
MTEAELPQAAIVPEGAAPTLVLPAGLRRVPRGVDELATEHLIVNMGPQHPSTHGVLHVLLELDGEEIVAAEASLGYLHRGIEKLAEHRRYNAVGTLLDRADYVSGIHTELAFALATEKLLEVEIPAKAQWLRSLMSEIVRITSHLVWMGTFGMDVGAMAPFLYIMRERESLLSVLESVTGARMMFNYIRPGGVLRDLTPDAEPKLRAFLRTFPGYLEEYHTLLTNNEIFQARVKGVGVIDRATAIGFGMSGPPLRASGFGWDVRKERPYAAYEELHFDVPVGGTGDCWDRHLVRMEEMRIAAELIGQCLDGMPEGELTAKVPKVIKPPAGEAYAAVESPRGEVGIHLVSDGTDTPARMHLRAPSLTNLSVIDEVLPGHKIADAVAIIGSLDIVLGEIDR